MALAAALALLAMSSAVGLRLAPMHARPLRSPLLALAGATALGLGVIATILLCLSAAFGVNAVSIWTAMGVSLIIAASTAARLRTLLRECAAEWRRVATLPVNIALVTVIVLLWLGAAPAPVDFDSLMYHLRGPELYLQAGRILAPEGNGHVAYVGAMHTLYLPFLLLGLDASPALLQAVILTLTLVAVAAATESWFRVRVAAPLLILALGTPIFLRVGATAMIDSSAAAYLILAHLMLLATLRRPRDGVSFAAVAGALLGIAVGIKILSAAYAAATAAVLLPLLFRRPRTRPLAIKLASVATGVALLAAAPWLARTAVLYGSPVYPYLSERQLPAWTARADVALAPPPGTSALRLVREPFTLRAWFLAPGTLTPEGDGHLFGASFALLVLALIPFTGRSTRILVIVLPALLFLGFVLGWSRFLNLRYLMPLLLPLTIGSAAVMALLARRWLSGRRAAFVSVGAATAFALVPTASLVRELQLSERPLAAIGAMDAVRYETKHNEIGALTAHLNTALPDSARVLFLFEARAFGIERTVLQDNVMEHWRLLRPLIASGSCLQEFGVTHVVIGRATLRYLIARGWPAERDGIAEMDAFLQRCTISGTGDALHGVFTMRPLGATP